MKMTPEQKLTRAELRDLKKNRRVAMANYNRHRRTIQLAQRKLDIELRTAQKRTDRALVQIERRIGILEGRLN